MASSRPRQTVIAVRYMDGEGEREEEGEGEREWALVEFQGEVLGAREAAAEEAMEKWGNGRGGTATIGEICCSASSKVWRSMMHTYRHDVCVVCVSYIRTSIHTCFW